MKNIKFKIDIKEKYTKISFKLRDVITPDILINLNPPQVDKTKGVILSGSGPIWFYGYLVHFYHTTKFIAFYEPRLDRGVVIETHTIEHKIGDLISL